MSIKPYRSQHSKPRTNIIGIKVFFVFAILFTAVFSTPVQATITKELHMEWQFTTTLPDLAGYKIFKDGLLLLTVDTPAAQSFDFSAELEEGKTAVFTMKAFYANGTESALSPPYSIDVPPGADEPVTDPPPPPPADPGEPEANVPPTPIVNVSTSAGEAPHVVGFSAAESIDSDGTIVSYAWDFGDGSMATAITTNHVYAVAGKYTASLTVTDNDGSIATAHTTITISAPAKNTHPTAHFSPTATSGAAPFFVYFDGTMSSDIDGTITDYSWNFGDGQSATGATASHEYHVAGTYTVTLTVWDNNNISSQASVLLTVQAAKSREQKLRQQRAMQSIMMLLFEEEGER